MGIRRGVQLIVINDRLFEERLHDARILRVDGIFGEAHEDDNPVRARLRARIGAPYARAMRATLAPNAVRETIQDLTAILRDADAAAAPRRALCLLAADDVANKLSQWLTEGADAGDVRRLLARYGAKLGGMTHYGGLEYRHELLELVWHQSPDTEAGELAFLELQRTGWNNGPGGRLPAGSRSVPRGDRESGSLPLQPTRGPIFATQVLYRTGRRPTRAGGLSPTRPRTTNSSTPHLTRGAPPTRNRRSGRGTRPSATTARWFASRRAVPRLQRTAPPAASGTGAGYRPAPLLLLLLLTGGTQVRVPGPAPPAAVLRAPLRSAPPW